MTKDKLFATSYYPFSMYGMPERGPSIEERIAATQEQLSRHFAQIALASFQAVFPFHMTMPEFAEKLEKTLPSNDYGSQSLEKWSTIINRANRLSYPSEKDYSFIWPQSRKAQVKRAIADLVIDESEVVALDRETYGSEVKESLKKISEKRPETHIIYPVIFEKSSFRVDKVEGNPHWAERDGLKGLSGTLYSLGVPMFHKSGRHAPHIGTPWDCSVFIMTEREWDGQSQERVDNLAREYNIHLTRGISLYSQRLKQAFHAGHTGLGVRH